MLKKEKKAGVNIKGNTFGIKGITFDITRAQLELVMTHLQAPMHGKEARSRNKFIELVGEEYHKMFPMREELLTKYSEKDENGKAKIENGLFAIPADKQDEAKNAMKEMLDTKISFVLDKATRGVVIDVRTILEGTKKEMGIAEGKMYDEVMNSLESI
jgi:hypothetical protein